MRKKLEYIIILMLILLMAPPSVSLQQQSNSDVHFATPSGVQDVSAGYCASREQAKIQEFMDINWSESTDDVSYLPMNSDGFIPIEREQVIHNTDYNDTNQSFEFYNKFGDSQINTTEQSSNGAEILAEKSTDYGSPSNAFPALPMTPAKSGHWFPQKSYSVLAFEWDHPDYLWHVSLQMDIERDQDSSNRYLTVYFDGSIVYHAIIGVYGFQGGILISYIPAGSHKVEVQINYGGCEYGWKMNYIWPWIALTGPDVPIPDFWEYFPGGNSNDINPTLDFQVKAGRATYIDVYIENMDSSSRNIEIWRGSSLSSLYLWKTISADTAYRLYMSYYSSPRDYYIRLKLLENPAAHYGARISYNCVNYRQVRCEVDYMSDLSGNPVMSTNDMNTMLEYVKSYYILHGYARPDYYLNNQIPFDESYSPIIQSQIRTLHNRYYNHKGNSDYEWVLIANAFNLIDGNGWYSAGGLYYPDGDYEWGIIMFSHGLMRWSNSPPNGYGYGSFTEAAKTAFLHEFGHFVGILTFDWQGKEVYCLNPKCCMSEANSESVIAEPWYCAAHWYLRDDAYKT
ncbi:MAG: hypothetical protein ACTSUO_09320 [Candidatus Thorarchaeota archaeon]